VGSCVGREILSESLMHLSQQSLGVVKLLFECMCHWGFGRVDGWKGVVWPEAVVEVILNDLVGVLGIVTFNIALCS